MRGARPLRVQVAEVSQQLHARGWVANHDGNVTIRDGARYLATPTATSKRLVTERDVLELDGKGAPVGAGKVFGEIGLHLTVYERRPDVNCVVHAHPPYATAIASTRVNPIEQPFIAEAVVSLGPKIPKVPYAQPGDAARVALAPWCELVDVVLLGNHGVLAWGADAEQALLRLELVEHLAKIACAAAPLGGVERLPAEALPPLLAARAKANLGRAADRAVQTAGALTAAASTPLRVHSGPVVACAPAPHAPVATVAPGGTHGTAMGDLAAIVRDEVVRALKA